jgi:hypothetical protein
MGYTFMIGQAALLVPEKSECDEIAALRVHVAKVVRVPDAPGGWNRLDVGCAWWSHAMRIAGIDDILADKGAYNPPPLLMPHHPGAAMLAPSHLARFEAAHSRCVAAGYADVAEATAWLVWWTRWALDNCKIPTLANR